MTMTKRDDTSMAEQNAEIRRWAEAAMLRATYDGYDNASEVVEAALREWARGY